ncbi:MAG: hypothetical protein KDE63_03425 [Novosphingobium sp.]|nr:hypothetical protein [Novosphingobium sp.]
MNSDIAPSTGTAEGQAGKRIVVIDQTAPGGVTATGALKETYFGNIPAERLLMVHDTGMLERHTLRAGLNPRFWNTRVYRGIGQPLGLIRAFKPDILIYRPLPSAPLLHHLACTLAIEDRLPLLLWFMDDWPERLRATNPGEADAIEHDLRRLAERAIGCFAISASMASAFHDRYGGPPYQIAHNGIRPEDWSFPRPLRSENQGILIRYSGGLAPDMSLDSVISLARTVSDLVIEGKSVRLEIRTQKHWLHRYGQLFAKLRGISISPAGGSQAEYRRWIAGADIGVVAYNFDEETIRYTRYSFANKVPELMAAGSAVLAIGPSEIETIRYLQEHGVAAIADRPDVLPSVLLSLLNDPAKRRALAVTAQDHAKLLILDSVRQKMDAFLSGPSRTDEGAPDAINLIRNAPPAFGWRALDWLHIRVRHLKWTFDRFWRQVVSRSRIQYPANHGLKGSRHGK